MKYSASFLTGRLQNIVLLTALLMLVGCKPMGVIGPIEKGDQPGANEGALTLTVHDLVPGVRKFDKLALIKSGSNKQAKPIELWHGKKNGKNSYTFGSYLPPGVYSIQSFQATVNKGNATYTYSLSVNPAFGTFKIVRGSLTDLGDIIVYLNAVNDRSVPVVAKIPDTTGNTPFKNDFNFFKGKDYEVLGWNTTMQTSSSEDAFYQIAQNPIDYYGVTTDSKGNTYLSSGLGAIRVRDAEGNWRLEGVEENASLPLLEVSDRGEQILGGIYGKFYYRAHENEQFEPIEISPDESVIDAIFTGEKTGMLLTKNQSTFLLKTFDLSKNGTPVINTMNTYKSTREWSYTDDGKKKKNFNIGKGFARFYQNSNKTFVLLDFSWGIYNEYPSDDGREHVEYDYIYELQPDFKLNRYRSFDISEREINKFTSGQRTVYQYTTFVLNEPDEYYFYNEEKNDWQELRIRVDFCDDGQTHIEDGCLFTPSRLNDRFRKKGVILEAMELPWFKTKDVGYSVAYIPESRNAEKDHGQVVIVRTEDAGENWIITSKEPAPWCRDILNAPIDTLTVTCKGFSADIYESDDGKEWRKVADHTF